jgi:hypothetical protein
VAALYPNIFCNFYSVKHHKTAKNSTTTKAIEKNKHRFGILRILEIFDVCLTKLKKYNLKIKLATDVY